jgi:hypothetical protein
MTHKKKNKSNRPKLHPLDKIAEIEEKMRAMPPFKQRTALEFRQMNALMAYKSYLMKKVLEGNVNDW